MKDDFGKSRASLAMAIEVLYLLPIVIISAFSFGLMPLNSSWKVFSIGLLLSVVGSGILFFLIKHWEYTLRHHLESSIKQRPAPLPEPVSQPSQSNSEAAAIAEQMRITQEKLIQDALSEAQRKHEDALAGVTTAKNEELHQSFIERKTLQEQILSLRREFDLNREKSHAQLQDERHLNAGLQQTISEQSTLIEKQQEKINDLEIKERELSYEIRTLISLNNYDDVSSSSTSSATPELTPTLTLYEPKKSPAPSSEKISAIVNSAEKASSQLEHFVDVASSMASMQGLHGVPSHLNDLPIDNYSLDLKRLCESLNMENRYVVLLQSPRENKPLFVNDHVKTVLGWTPDKFKMNFPTIIQKGFEDWKKEIGQLNQNREAICQLQAQTADNEETLLNCHMKAISSGTFRSHILAILYR